MRVLVTGADGFIGRNLVVALGERGHTALPFTRATQAVELPGLVAAADAVVHLAGANRPPDPTGFQSDNANLSRLLANALLSAGGPRRPVVFASSTQAAQDNPYGVSKRMAEDALMAATVVADVQIFRLTNVFGKWARPFYNSAVATFCHCAARGEPLPINDRSAPLKLIYVDDVVATFIDALENPLPGGQLREAGPIHATTVGEVADLLTTIAQGREALRVVETGSGLVRALHATYLTHLPHDRFDYPLTVHGDARGIFVETVKTPSAGQFSFFTQKPGVVRGGHYHHSKSEKFVVVKGRARFRFRHLLTGERVDVDASADAPSVVDTIPGWVHDVMNMSDEDLVVLIWANEVFDRDRPDTIAEKVDS
ncbi:MAG: NAD-dependent epimerase/dehydratase family protein [Sandaracinobacter sp.]